MSENNDFRHEEQGYNTPENLYHFNYNEQHNAPVTRAGRRSRRRRKALLLAKGRCKGHSLAPGLRSGRRRGRLRRCRSLQQRQDHDPAEQSHGVGDHCEAGQRPNPYVSGGGIRLHGKQRGEHQLLLRVHQHFRSVRAVRLLRQRIHYHPGRLYRDQPPCRQWRVLGDGDAAMTAGSTRPRWWAATVTTMWRC